jgi:Raf kinase inhibitor-like YbhB/YbcL family protein
MRIWLKLFFCLSKGFMRSNQLIRYSGCTLALYMLVACGGSGGTNNTLPTSKPFAISSANYTNNGVMPDAAACTAKGGSNASPQVTLSDLPANTKQVAVLMDDEVGPCGTGTNACVHWAVFNLPATKTQISAGENLSSIPEVKYGTTYDGQTSGYQGPCPPTNHTYKLTAYALKESMPVISTTLSKQNSTRASFESAYASHIIDKVTLTGKYPQ